MSVKEQVGGWLRPIVYLGRNPISLTGAVLTTSSAFTVIAFWLFEIVLGGGASRYPYAGILFYLVLPTVFIIGLLLMPLGALLRRHQLLKRGELPELYPKVDLGEPLLRRGGGVFNLATLLNIFLFTTGSHQCTQYPGSVEFWGPTSHPGM